MCFTENSFISNKPYICLFFFSGYKVSDTVRKGILDVTLYNNNEKELMLGSLAALGEWEKD